MVIPGGVYRKGPLPWVTIGLIVANTLVYAYTSYMYFFIQSSPQYVESLGFTPITLLSNPVQGLASVFTAMFTHADILHIFFNMYFLYLFGYRVENYLGRLRYLILYFVSGIFSSIFHLAYASVSGWSLLTIPAVGASGAISGVLGAYLILFPNTKMSMCTFFLFLPFCMPVSAYAFMILWFALQIIYGYFTYTTIATFAHVGGFLTGMILAWLIARGFSKRFEQTTGSPLVEILRALGIIFEYKRGLGRIAKAILVALILSVVAGYSYGTLSTISSKPLAYTLNISANGDYDSVLMVVSNSNVYVSTSQVDNVRILVNRLLDSFFYNKSLAGDRVAYNLQYYTTVSGITVPVTLDAEAVYDSSGVLEYAKGVLSSRVIKVNPATGSASLGAFTTISFYMSTVSNTSLYPVAFFDLFSIAVSLLAIISVIRSDEVSIVAEEAYENIPFI
ncbi:rhomboid family intramembrane serine protease [Thermogladius sp. 4427co]|uniref:rhomboid family intramembrane serine protease n=1 Tax=Thermogladius sp. 4427co TaxID=3450718 RepID=UPI003F7A7D30